MSQNGIPLRGWESKINQSELMIFYLKKIGGLQNELREGV